VGVVNPDETDDGRTEDSSFNNTRRQFVAGTAGALGGLAVGGSFVNPALAQEGDADDEGGTGDDSEGLPENEFEDDVDLLNYALTLEYLEAEFYRQGLENISEEELCTCEALNDESPIAERAYGELETIRAHEEAHAETLASAIEDLGGTPIEEPEFDFGLRVEYPVAFLATAAQFEDVGVSAYAGAAPFIESESLVPPALGIHSVEARHASFLRTLNDETSFPNAFDEARSRSDVLDLVGEFIVSEMDTEDQEPESDPEPDEADPETEEPTEDGTDTPGEDGTTDNGTDAPVEDGATDNTTDTSADNGTADNGTDSSVDNGTVENDTNTST
jgi:rubrerythrin